MSVEARPRCQRQRRLGVLRSFHESPRTSLESQSKYYLTDVHDDVFKQIDDVSSPPDLHFNDKVKRLHQARLENAVKNMRAYSVNNIQMEHKKDTDKDALSLRCSTAPSYRTVREYLKDKVTSASNQKNDSSLEQLHAKAVLVGTPRRRNRLATFPAIEKIPCLPLNLHPPSFLHLLERNTSATSSKSSIVNESIANIAKTNEEKLLLSKIRRTASAPPVVHRQGQATLLDTSNCKRNKVISFRKSLNQSSNNNKPHLKPTLHPTSSYRRHSARTKSDLPRKENSKDELLGIVGEQCKSNKPPAVPKTTYTVPTQRPGLHCPIRITHRIPQNSQSSEESTSSINVIPNQPNNTFTNCSCRSVRFNCTGNLIYEYMTNDPVAKDLQI